MPTRIDSSGRIPASRLEKSRQALGGSLQSRSIGEDTREGTRPFRGPHCHRNVEGMGHETQDTRVPLIWPGRPVNHPR
eukprot:4701902-Pyramimonas_sp.AAC.1